MGMLLVCKRLCSKVDRDCYSQLEARFITSARVSAKSIHRCTRSSFSFLVACSLSARTFNSMVNVNISSCKFCITRLLSRPSLSRSTFFLSNLSFSLATFSRALICACNDTTSAWAAASCDCNSPFEVCAARRSVISCWSGGGGLVGSEVSEVVVGLEVRFARRV